MTTLKNLKGTAIQFLDADPVTNTGSWASGNNTNSPHSGYGGSSGTYTAALVAANEPYGANVELYNGTSWTETGDLSTSRTSAYSAGTQPATWLGGGRTGPSSSTNNTETFNGSSWTEVNEMNTTRFSSGSTGTYTAGIAVAGNTLTDISRAVETWNGTTWSTHPNDYDADVAEVITFGTTTAAIMAGGFDGPAPRGGSNTSIATSYSYDGSTYTAITAMPQTLNATTGSGSQTDGLVSGGDRYPASNTANTISWNGTVWSQVQDVPVAAYGWGASKATTNTTNQTIFCGSPGQNTTTVDWAFPPPTATILQEGQMWFNSSSSTLKGYGTAAGIPAATWASGGVLNTARNGLRGAGISQDSALVFGGTTPGVVTESYNGTSWTEVNDLSTAITNSVGVGTQGAARAAMTTTNQGWDGTNWSEENNLNTSRQEVGSLGTKASCLAIGNQNGASAIVEQWDGTNWTEVGDLNTATGSSTGIGTTSSGRSVGGYTPGGATAVNQSWNGTSWSEEADINTARYFAGGSGSSGLGLIFGGYGPAHSAKTEIWNGTTWTEINDLGTVTSNGGPASSSPAGNALFAGGSAPGNTTKTEEWTASAVVSTVTTS